jgi:hypothetical protein
MLIFDGMMDTILIHWMMILVSTVYVILSDHLSPPYMMCMLHYISGLFLHWLCFLLRVHYTKHNMRISKITSLAFKYIFNKSIILAHYGNINQQLGAAMKHARGY